MNYRHCIFQINNIDFHIIDYCRSLGHYIFKLKKIKWLSMLTKHYNMSWCNIQSPAYFLLGCNIHYYLNSFGPHKDRYLYLKLWYLRYNFFSSCILHKHSIEDRLIMNNLNFMNMDSAHRTIHFFMTFLIGNHFERYTSLSHKIDYLESIILNLCITFLHRGPETQ